MTGRWSSNARMSFMSLIRDNSINIMEQINAFKNEGAKLRAEVREKTATYIMGGLGVVVGLAWNEAIKGLIEYFLPFAGAGTLVAKFVYAVLLTVIIVVATTYLFRTVEEGK